MSSILPRNLQKCLSNMLTVAKDFVPLGTFCLLLVDRVKVIRDMSTSDALAITARQMLEGAFHIGQRGASAPFVLQRLLSDHYITGYHSRLGEAVSRMHPVLFFGGTSDDYEQVVVQRQTVDGEPAICWWSKWAVCWCSTALCLLSILLGSVCLSLVPAIDPVCCWLKHPCCKYLYTHSALLSLLLAHSQVLFYKHFGVRRCH